MSGTGCRPGQRTLALRKIDAGLRSRRKLSSRYVESISCWNPAENLACREDIAWRCLLNSRTPRNAGSSVFLEPHRELAVNPPQRWGRVPSHKRPRHFGTSSPPKIPHKVVSRSRPIKRIHRTKLARCRAVWLGGRSKKDDSKKPAVPFASCRTFRTKQGCLWNFAELGSEPSLIHAARSPGPG